MGCKGMASERGLRAPFRSGAQSAPTLSQAGPQGSLELYLSIPLEPFQGRRMLAKLRAAVFVRSSSRVEHHPGTPERRASSENVGSSSRRNSWALLSPHVILSRSKSFSGRKSFGMVQPESA
eukprot:scaffold123493_cov30-Phaeocystis_antarctica.AAC.1